jgi:hypothetical protein
MDENINFVLEDRTTWMTKPNRRRRHRLVQTGSKQGLLRICLTAKPPRAHSIAMFHSLLARPLLFRAWMLLNPCDCRSFLRPKFGAIWCRFGADLLWLTCFCFQFRKPFWSSISEVLAFDAGIGAVLSLRWSLFSVPALESGELPFWVCSSQLWFSDSTESLLFSSQFSVVANWGSFGNVVSREDGTEGWERRAFLVRFFLWH